MGITQSSKEFCHYRPCILGVPQRGAVMAQITESNSLPSSTKCHPGFRHPSYSLEDDTNGFSRLSLLKSILPELLTTKHLDFPLWFYAFEDDEPFSHTIPTHFGIHTPHSLHTKDPIGVAINKVCLTEKSQSQR